MQIKLFTAHKSIKIALKYAKILKAKEKYRGVFEIQKSGDKTGSGEIGLDIRTHASPKVGQDQVSGGVSVLCWHAAPVASKTRRKFEMEPKIRTLLPTCF